MPPGLSNMVAMAAGNAFSLALRSDGTVVGWGDNRNNETNVPAGLTNIVGITAGGSQSVALIGSGPPVESAPLVSPQWSSAWFSVSLSSQCGRVYALESKNSLADPVWTGLPLVAGTGGALTLSDTNASLGRKFYRVRRW